MYKNNLPAGILMLLLLGTTSVYAQITNPLRGRIEDFIRSKNATIGVAIGGPDDRDTLTVNGAGHYPMHSVYKFHLAVAILDQVDKGKFKLDQKILVKKTDLLPGNWSPLRDAYPEAEITMTIKDLLSYAVSQSDNNACDILFRLIGGPKEVNKYIHSIAVRDVNIVATEEETAKSWDVQYTDWSTPFAAVLLLKKFNEKGILSPKNHDLLWDLMVNSLNNNRIKGSLPAGTIVAHKTGTSGTNAQNIMAATNDIGIVNLPDGKHFSIAVFVSDSKDNDSLNSRTIAGITQLAWEYYAEKSLALARQKFDVSAGVDSLINAGIKAKKPFNGTILISQNGKKIYSKVFGFSDIDKKIALLPNDQYVIGSISKQVTAVLVLQEVEKGHIVLQLPIHTYLPDLPAKWADTVTVHQLLTHTHGITALDQPLAFRPGMDFQYSQIGYDLLAKIVEKTSKKSFAALSAELFEKCNMRSTFHPDLHKSKGLVKGYTEQPDGKPELATGSGVNYVAAGGFISTPNDLLTWNTCLHGGKFFADSNNYKLMTTGYATSNHPVFGPVDYGYGITTSNQDNILQLGQSGYTPGYVSLDFYFPASKTSVIILSNLAREPDNLTNTFLTETQILAMIKQQSNLITKTYK